MTNTWNKAGNTILPMKTVSQNSTPMRGAIILERLLQQPREQPAAWAVKACRSVESDDWQADSKNQAQVEKGQSWEVGPTRRRDSKRLLVPLGRQRRRDSKTLAGRHELERLGAHPQQRMRRNNR